ncbi:hypothetical protein PCANC_08864 [Puccinia coronata f. sp. avenae]|uniref:GATA-type domain-containing protein n=1 Tax=Puccinia coronata f. sp. avenae TaxID=200324 RepID=A0A2N5VS68_9BASI|nr:hypothetical protein PCASD_10408 [Puccinia coronata f. sp. avenae]PLW52827.1 hypothetical protein PCANC_08864 [Puccinia coronata f. sp. avenae]
MFYHSSQSPNHLQPKSAKQPAHQQQQPEAEPTRHQPVSSALPNPPTHPNSRQQGAPTPTCANCGTQTTPLWRRNQSGATLCNACALFQKMKGRPRPISLKTNVIKPRNRVKAIDRIPLARSTSFNQQEPAKTKKTNNRLSASVSSNSSSSCSTPLRPTPSIYQQLHQQQQPNLIQLATSRLNHSPRHSPDPQVFAKNTLLLPPNPNYNNHYLKLSKQSCPDPFPSASPSHNNVLLASYPRQAELSPLVRSGRKSLPGGPDCSSLCPDSSCAATQPKRRKYSVHQNENAFPAARRTLSGSPELSHPHGDSDLSYSLPSPPTPPLHSSADHHHTEAFLPLTSQKRVTSRESTLDSSAHEESQRNATTPSLVERYGQTAITLPPLSQLTRHLQARTPLQSSGREPGPPMSFEASARQARLHSPVSPAPHLLGIPRGRSTEPRRALSVHSSVSDSDSVLSPIQLATPYTSSPPDPLSRPRYPITPPILAALPTPLDFHHRRASQPAPHRQPLEATHAISPRESPVPLEEVCQLKQRIAELEIINGRMVSRLGQLERRSNTPPVPPPSHPLHHRDQQQDLRTSPHLQVSASHDEEEDMIDTSL